MADNTSDFIKKFKKHKAAATKAAQTEAKAILSDSEIAEALDLGETEKKVFDARASRLRLGVDKNGKEYAAFNYVLLSGKRGLQLGPFIGLDDSDDEKYERNLRALFGTLQRLGFDTTTWKAANVLDNLVKASETIAEEKPAFKLGLSKYVQPNTKAVFLNYSIIALSEPNEAEGGEESDDQYEAADPPDQNDGASEPDDTDYSEWVGYECTFELDGETKEGTTQTWNDEARTFDVSDNDNPDDIYELSVEEVSWPE